MMKQPIVLESNQNHATITNSGKCPTLSASMGLGGGYVPMVVIIKGEDLRIGQLQSNDFKRSNQSASCR